MELARDRIMEAIQMRVVRTTQGAAVQLDDYTGIDILGNMIESSILGPNQGFYGDLHNLGHMAISYCHDPDHRYLVRTMPSSVFMIACIYIVADQVSNLSQ